MFACISTLACELCRLGCGVVLVDVDDIVGANGDYRKLWMPGAMQHLLVQIHINDFLPGLQ